MEVEVASSIPARSAPCILTGKLQAQLLASDTTKDNSLTIFEYNQTRITKQQNNLPTTIDQNGYC